MAVCPADTSPRLPPLPFPYSGDWLFYFTEPDGLRHRPQPEADLDLAFGDVEAAEKLLVGLGASKPARGKHRALRG
ncbi:hypothetical protein [Streptomyces sp. R33]|uniref:Uncharacterized protein n=1 Tax=Streptomyces sp. R33 TaxID=3238629 RepID=A0AB39YEX0_9ACTN